MIFYVPFILRAIATFDIWFCGNFNKFFYTFNRLKNQGVSYVAVIA